MFCTLLLLPGDGIGPEIMSACRIVLDRVNKLFDIKMTLKEAPIGGAGYDAFGEPLPKETLELARTADAILLGAVGGPLWERLPRQLRPERGLLAIRAELDLFANLRPALLFEPLADASSLKKDLVANLDLMIVRELTSGIYFGQPRGIEHGHDGKMAFNTMRYTEKEIERIAEVAFKIAEQRRGRLCSVDKANVLEVSELWREVMDQVGKSYPNVALSHMYVDNAAMQLVREPKQFDVMVTSNLFGDILSDCAAMLTGSIGMLPSASLDVKNKGLYEPVHGSAPDIAGKDMANPLAMILSAAMMYRYTLARPDCADAIEAAVKKVLTTEYRTADLATSNHKQVGTAAMGELVAQMVAYS